MILAAKLMATQLLNTAYRLSPACRVTRVVSLRHPERGVEFWQALERTINSGLHAVNFRCGSSPPEQPVRHFAIQKPKYRQYFYQM